MPQRVTIYTIGYEGVTIDAFLARLVSEGIAHIADIRALPLSRRPGFSKNSLAAALAEEGIGYTHYKALGTPKEGRDAAKKGDRKTLQRVYAGQLQMPEAIAAGAQLLAQAAERPTALLCYEREPEMCHRSLLLDDIAPDAQVVNLTV